MRVIKVVLLLLGIILLAGCISQGKTMILLDEKIVKIEVSRSNGVGNVNEDILISFKDKQTISVFEQAIRNSVKMIVDTNSAPDYDIVVSYGDRFPKHAIHLWLGDEKEKSILMYMVGEGETYTSSAYTTNQLRKLILKEQ